MNHTNDKTAAQLRFRSRISSLRNSYTNEHAHVYEFRSEEILDRNRVELQSSRERGCTLRAVQQLVRRQGKCQEMVMGLYEPGSYEVTIDSHAQNALNYSQEPAHSQY